MYAFVLLLLVSTDSWTHALYDHHDSATFFASGKAWASGMVPYVDFSDSKGPLLWLIYAVAYIISPQSVAGVFWLTCINYAFVFAWLYKIARIYVSGERTALLAAMLTALFIFYPWVRYETRAEDFALLFMLWALYHACRLLHGRPDDGGRAVRWAAGVMGIGMAATLLIKYNVTAIIGVMALFVLHVAWQSGKLWQAGRTMVVSFVMFLAPFVIYMLAVGCFDDFIAEYFVGNMQVVARQHQHMRHPLFMLIGHWGAMMPYLLAGGVSAIAIARCVTRYRAFVATVFAATLLLTVTNAFWLYYYALCAPFVVFGAVALLRSVERHRALSMPSCLAIGAGCVVVVMGMHMAHGAAWAWSDTPEQRTFDSYVDMMSQVQRPRVVYLGMHGMAFGTAVQSLPACRYWVSQSGATPAMDADQRQAVEQRRPDFVFVLKQNDCPDWLLSLGYVRHPNDSNLPALLYSSSMSSREVWK